MIRKFHPEMAFAIHAAGISTKHRVHFTLVFRYLRSISRAHTNIILHVFQKFSTKCFKHARILEKNFDERK